MIGAFDIPSWVALWHACHAIVQGSPVRLAFPDGRSLHRQSALTVTMFAMIDGEWAKQVAQGK